MAKNHLYYVTKNRFILTQHKKYFSSLLYQSTLNELVFPDKLLFLTTTIAEVFNPELF